MKVYLNSINVWLQGIDDVNALTQWAKNSLHRPEAFIPPKPNYYPKNQLRRLSPFSKVVLHCLDLSQALTQDLPLIFASQHGDLAKTVNLIKNAAVGEELSPTQFALSVHNATTGLFSIATSNTAPTTTISAGKNTFCEGLVEALLQCQQENTAVIYSYCDFDIPKEYHQFDERKPARCITMILSPENTHESLSELNFSMRDQTLNTETTVESDLPLCFIRHFHLQSQALFSSHKYSISLDFNPCRK